MQGFTRSSDWSRGRFPRHLSTKGTLNGTGIVTLPSANCQPRFVALDSERTTLMDLLQHAMSQHGSNFVNC